MTAARALVLEHVEAFNAHDTVRLLQGVDEDVVWATGSDVFYGRESLLTVFDDWLWGLDPTLLVERLVVDGNAVAMECTEGMLVDGKSAVFPIAVFFTVTDGRIASVRVYREGSADLPTGERTPSP